MNDNRTRAQRWADRVTEFSGSWAFIGWFTILCFVWLFTNTLGGGKFDPYPFLFLNWILTIVSTFQNPLILLSQNRQNETDRERVAEILSKLEKLQKTLDSKEDPELRNAIREGVKEGLEPVRDLVTQVENKAKAISSAARRLRK